MAKTFRIVDKIDDKPLFPVTLDVIWSYAQRGGALILKSPAEFITEYQRKWWKGVLLPAMSRESGEGESVWENRLKIEVMPDEFKPETVVVDGHEFTSLPSITTLSKSKMSKLIEGSVAYLHEQGYYWVQLPNPELRR